MDSNTMRLHEHHVACPPDGALSGFRLRQNEEDDPKWRIQYEYACKHGTQWGSSPPDSTSTDYVFGPEDKVFLDRHDVACGQDETINDFRMVSGGSRNRVRYNYSCMPLEDGKTNRTCETKHTEYDDEGDILYLGRHAVECDRGRVLKRFQLQREPLASDASILDPHQMRYEYECCEADLDGERKLYSTDPKYDGRGYYPTPDGPPRTTLPCFDYSTVQECQEHCDVIMDGATDDRVDACNDYCDETCSPSSNGDDDEFPIWNPLDSAFWDVENNALWIYVGILVVASIGIGIAVYLAIA